MMTREEVIHFITVMLRSPIAMFSKPDREQAFQLAKDLEITAEELLQYAYEKRTKR